MTVPYERRFFDGWDAGCTKGTPDDVIKSVMPGVFTWRLLAHHCMKAVCINQGDTATLMWDAQAQAKPHADCNTHCFVVQTHATVSDCPYYYYYYYY